LRSNDHAGCRATGDLLVRTTIAMSMLAQVAIFLVATVIAIPLFRRLGLGAVLGYLAAGIAIGPSGLGIVSDVDATLHFAEFGVVLLLFVIGLELQPSRLWVMRKSVFGLGAAQVFATTTIFFALGLRLGLSATAAFIAGFALSLSSTPLVLQLLAERGELTTQHGRSAFSILLFQDIAVMPVLSILPLLGPAAGTGRSLLLDMSRALAALVVLVFGGRLILRPILRLVAGTAVKEAFTAAALLVVIGTALIAAAAGLSMALGAFIGGLLLADSEYRHALEADLEPFKGLLLGLFFMAVGMSLSVATILARPLLILVMVGALIAIKMAVLWALARMTGHDRRAALGLAFALPQAGEFGFVLFTIAVGQSVLDPELADLLVIVVTVSMVASPLLMGINTRFIEPRFAAPVRREFDRIEDDDSRVIIAGFGRFGQIIGRTLRMRRIRFTALEASPAQVDFVRRFGNKIYYGDASRRDLLDAAGIRRAEVLVVAIDDIEASVRLARLAMSEFPHLKLFVRARNRQHALELMALGVRYIVRDTYLSSLDMAQHVLETLGLARHDAERSVQRFREHDEQALARQFEHRDDEQKLIQSVQLAARELEQLFDEDTAGTGNDGPTRDNAS
jgi:glutathione-regulated potassium-efflux system protein KefB